MSFKLGVVDAGYIVTLGTRFNNTFNDLNHVRNVG